MTVARCQNNALNYVRSVIKWNSMLFYLRRSGWLFLDFLWRMFGGFAFLTKCWATNTIIST